PSPSAVLFFVLFTCTALTWISTLSLHDALPIYVGLPLVAHDLVRNAQFLEQPQHALRTGIVEVMNRQHGRPLNYRCNRAALGARDRKSTRLNSSHVKISYAVFCLKKKNKKTHHE